MRGRLILQDGEARTVLHALLEQAAMVRRGVNGRHLEFVRVEGQHLERADANAARAAEHRDALHGTSPSDNKPSRKVGAAAVRLSIRSSRPPWPGSSEPLSFKPTCRLNMLSVRSPTTETSATTSQRAS